MRKYLLEITVFISGACLMIFELVGSRMFAPFLGTSLVVWTSLIGVIMGSLSLGYYLGGKLSDKNLSYKILAIILLSASIAVAFAAFVQYFILLLLQQEVSDLRWSSLIAACILFGPASTFFGMVSPYAIKLKLNDLKHSGEKIGSMYAISTLGSIFGTFVSGFFLIPFLGTAKILFCIILCMLFSAIYILLVDKNLKKKEIRVIGFFLAFLILFGLVGGGKVQGVIDVDTKYSRIFIFETKDPKTERPIRAYTGNPYGTHSAIFLDKDDDLVFDYLKFYRLGNYFNADIKTSLMIGGGMYTYPRDFFRKNPKASMDIVEIDDDLEKIAKEYFNFSDDDRINIFNEDGRVFLNNNDKVYDCIFIDAFNSHSAVPFQLTTKETVASLYGSLSEDGVIVANIISSINGDSGRFLRAEIATYKEFFPQVYIFPVTEKDNPDRVQNISLIALKTNKAFNFQSEDEELNEYLSHLWQGNISEDMPVLTDDYAPVDYYALSFIPSGS